MKNLLFVLVVILAVLIQFQGVEAKQMKVVKEWTFLTFMNGHDSMLTHYTDPNLDLMKSVGSTDDVNIVVQVASQNRQQTERVYIEKGNVKLIEKLPDRVDMGDYKELIQFIEWTVENYPAKKYFINVWNHGMGWHELQFENPTGFPVRKGFQSEDVSLDSYTGNSIKTEEMAIVMRRFKELTGRKVELYGNDACVMAMIEIATEIDDSVAYFASSQENEPAAGWPYDKVLERWVANPTINGGELGTILAEEYLEYYPDDNINPMGTTFSVIDVRELGGLLKSIKAFKDELLSLNRMDIISQVATSTHRFDGGNDYKDLMDFVRRIEQRTELSVNKSTLDNIKNAYNRVLIKNVTSEGESNANGLSVWLPTFDLYYNSNISRYKNLVFDKKTGWSDLLDLFFAESVTTEPSLEVRP